MACLRLFVIVLVVVFVKCQNQIMTNSHHKSVLKTHNTYFYRYMRQQQGNSVTFNSNNHMSMLQRLELGDSNNLSSRQKLHVIEAVNKLRKENEQSTNMNVLRWNEVLAAKALNETKDCSYINKGNGAILAMVDARKTGTSLISEAIGRWSEEKNRFSLGEICSYKGVCRYSQIVWAKSQEIGCGATRCNDMNFLACMYDPPGNLMHQQAYIAGSSCTACDVPPNYPMRCNSDNLCEWYYPYERAASPP